MENLDAWKDVCMWKAFGLSKQVDVLPPSASYDCKADRRKYFVQNAQSMKIKSPIYRLTAEGEYVKAPPDAGGDVPTTCPTMMPEMHEREFVVDSGAAYHMVDKRDLTEWERSTVRWIPVPITLSTANGLIKVEYCARVKVLDLGIEVKALVSENTPCVLSQSRLVRESSFAFVHLPHMDPYLWNCLL